MSAGLRPVIEIGGTHVTAALVDLDDAAVVELRRVPLDGDAPAAEILDVVAAAIRSLSAGSAGSLGVAIPGPFDYGTGIGRFEGVGKFTRLNGVDVKHGLLARLGSSVTQIAFVNDADAFGLGEWQLLAEPVSRAMFLTFGTGIGSCFVEGGQLVRNRPGLPPDGHVHHLNWSGRPLEDWVSRRAIIARYEAVSGRSADVKEIAELASRGDRFTQQTLDEAFSALGSCVAPLVRSFSPEVIVIGGSIAKSWDLVIPPFVESLRASLVDAECPRLIPAARPEESPLLGAALVASRAAKGLS